MKRRAFLIGMASLLPAAAIAQGERLRLSGPLSQGSLVIGRGAGGAALVLDGKPLRATPDGIFAFGLAYDRTDPVKLVASYPDGTAKTRDIVPVVRTYEEQRIDGLKQEMVTPPDGLLERIKRENEKVYAARDIDSDGAAFAEAFDWPAAGIVSGVFGSRRILNGEPRSPHFGVDIAALEGAPILSPADGTVTLTGQDFYFTGNTTVLDHGHGVSTTYQHQSRQLVAVGQQVKRGEAIGLVGKTGRATGPHLHWALNWFQIRLDPSLSARTPLPPRG
jgi:murein DD-endopeptidase MepM/ murein hydrolase activator NlpD